MRIGLGFEFALAGNAEAPGARKTENVIVVMNDGTRWEELFRGADPEPIKTLGPDARGAPKQRTVAAQQHRWRPTPTERR